MHRDILLRAFLEDRIEWTECLEMLALCGGRKNVVRLTGQPSRLENLAVLARELGLASGAAQLHLETRFDTTLMDHFSQLAAGYPQAGEEGILFIGSKTTVAAALELETSGCPSDAAARLYGYPECCAHAYQQHIQSGHSLWVDAFFAETHGIARLPWQMNRTGRLFAPYLSLLPDYFPCSPTCAESLKLARSYSDMLDEIGLGSLENLIHEHLARPLLLHAGCLYRLHTVQGAVAPSDNPRTFRVQVMDALPYAGTALASRELTLSWDSEKLALCAPGSADNATAVLIMFE